MREKAKQVLLKFKDKDKELEKIFNEYVDSLVNELEIPKDIAVKIVTDEIVNRYEKRLILFELFSKETLSNVENL